MNKNLMNMDGMKRAAKMLMSGGSDLRAVVLDQKSLMAVIVDKLIPNVNKVGTNLLKWSYAESNYTFADVFSAWADLDAGFTQLLQEYLGEFDRYRKSFKDIITEAKKVSDLQKEKEKTASKVAATHTKLDNAKKALKKNEHNEKVKNQVSNIEADLFVARSKDEEADELLKNAIAEFEFYKASMLKDSLTTHCRALKSLLEKGVCLCQTKLDIAEAMPYEPATSPDSNGENKKKVEDIYNHYHLQLPARDAMLGRQVPMEKFKTMPAPQTCCPPKSPQVINQTPVPTTHQTARLSRPIGGVPVYNPVSDIETDDEEDDDDYMMPSEGVLTKAVSNIPPALPPRNVVEEEEEYVIPTLSPNSGKQFSPTATSQSDVYFEMASDDEGPRRPGEARKPPKSPRPQEKEPPVPEDEPVYVVPPEEEADGEYNQLYRNMPNEELQEPKRPSANVPVRQYVKPPKPAPYPRPNQRTSKEVRVPPRQESSCPTDGDTAEDEDIYSLVYDEDPSADNTGLSPTMQTQQHTFTDSDRQSDSPEINPRQTHIHKGFSQSDDSLDSIEPPTEPESSDIHHTYFNMCMGDKVVSDSNQIYGNIPDDHLHVPKTEKKVSPVVKRKPPVLTKKPIAAVRKSRLPEDAS